MLQKYLYGYHIIMEIMHLLIFLDVGYIALCNDVSNTGLLLFIVISYIPTLNYLLDYYTAYFSYTAILIPRPSMNIRSNGQKSRSQGHKVQKAIEWPA